jgi:hypothetical protein
MLRLGEIRPLRDVLIEMGKLVDPDGRDVKEYVEGWLSLPRRQPWTLESPAVLPELNEVPPGSENEEEVEAPELATREGLNRVLGGDDVRGIISNARQQKPDVSLDEIFDAFRYYYEFDAFKEFD